MISKILEKLSELKSGDKLVLNSFFIFLNTALGSLIGFFFWKIAVSHFSNSEIGTAASYVSMCSLIALFSELGTSNTLIRFFSEKEDKNLANSVFTLISISSIIILPGIILILKNIFRIFEQLFQSFYYVIIFVFLVYSLTVNQFLNSLFFAKREAKYAFFKELVNILLRLIFIIFIIFAISGELYILIIWTIANISALLFGYIILLKKAKIPYPYPKMNLELIKKVFKFSAANYIYRVLNFLPGLFYPTLVSEYISTEQASYFYISWMVSNLLFAIGSSVNTSFMAESSSNLQNAREKIKKALSLLGKIYTGLIPILILSSPFVLLIFGKEYLIATPSFVILLISSIFVSLNHLFAGTMNILKQSKYIVLVYGTSTSLSIFLPFLFIKHFSLTGFAIGWIISQLIGTLTGLFVIIINKNRFIEIEEKFKKNRSKNNKTKN